MMKRTAIIGDVHGVTGPLQQLVTALSLTAGDRLIFVGDLVDKGPDTAGTAAYAARLAAEAAFEVVLVEGNHEDRHRRYRQNITQRPSVAAEQAAEAPQLPILTQQLSAQSAAFLDAAVPFYRVDDHDVLVVHGGIPGNMTSLPASAADFRALKGKAKTQASKILRTRFITADTGAYLALGKEREGDPFWAEVYDGRFGHVVFGHQPFLSGPAEFPHATGIDTGAVHGGPLTALLLEEGQARRYVQVPGITYQPYKKDPMALPQEGSLN
ncbi:MAG: metallophosphoesterase [Pseudomonadota bacterium]